MIKNNEINNREFAPLKFSYSKLPEDWHERIFGRKESEEIKKQEEKKHEIAPSR